METIKIYFLKVLKKLKIHQYFNFSFSKRINHVKVYIPITEDVGLTNMILDKDWLDLLIESFVFSEDYYTFIDVGVNIGQTLLRLKTISPQTKYLGFEPNSSCVNYVQKLIKKNQFGDCRILNAALSTDVNILELEKESDTDSRASLISDLRPNYFSVKESVLAMPYQQFFLNEKIGFVKIDVEGGEYEVLAGMEKAIQKHQPVITCEVLDSHSAEVLEFTQIRATKLCDMLKSWNYNIIRLQTGVSKIVDFEKLDSIKIVQWTSRSYCFNDYLFYPQEKENMVVDKLYKIING